ncbi:MAG: citrate/2-methylcitrate synthase [Myxococcota bacterium]
MNGGSPWLAADEACALLDVKKQTLYAYVSRGLIRSSPDPAAPRKRLYSRPDVDRVRRRSAARSGHQAVAAGALQFGQPVLDSELTAIAERGHAYRGQSAIRLAETSTFEAAAELLFEGALPAEATTWVGSTLGLPRTAVKALRTEAVLDRLSGVVPLLAARDSARQSPDLGKARLLIRRLAGALALSPVGPLPEDAMAEERIAAILLRALGVSPNPTKLRAVDRALILCADHELNPSSFSARVTAAAGGDIYASVASALATLSGPRHGGATDRVEALVEEVGAPERALSVLSGRVRRGEPITGFSHPLYPRGDPRAVSLLGEAQRIGGRLRAVRCTAAVVEAAEVLGVGRPTVDVGLVSLRHALRLPESGGAALFAVGRSAGWIAHAREQRAAGFLLRPRARYVGPPIDDG